MHLTLSAVLVAICVRFFWRFCTVSHLTILVFTDFWKKKFRSLFLRKFIFIDFWSKYLYWPLIWPEVLHELLKVLWKLLTKLVQVILKWYSSPLASFSPIVSGVTSLVRFPCSSLFSRPSLEYLNDRCGYHTDQFTPSCLDQQLCMYTLSGRNKFSNINWLTNIRIFLHSLLRL